MKTDSRGLALSGADDFAVARYDAAIGHFQSYVGDPIGVIDEALASSPAFVAGHLLKANVLYTLAERQFVPMAAAALDAAKAHARTANDRERLMIDATGKLVAGDWHRAGGWRARGRKQARRRPIGSRPGRRRQR